MAIPVVLYAINASQALPIVAVRVVRGRHPPAPHLRLSIWCAVLLSADVLDIGVAALVGTNRFTSWVLLPVEVALTFWILAAWQPELRMRRAYMTAIPISLIAAAAAMAAFGPERTFDIWLGPLLALSALGGTVHTLVHRSLWSRSQLFAEDWFWILLGMSFLWVGFVPVPAFMFAIIDSAMGWVSLILLSRAWLVFAAFLLITWGILCPRILARSSGPSLQPAPLSS